MPAAESYGSMSGLPSHSNTSGVRGMALIMALLATLVLSGLGLALLTTSATETLIAASYRDGVEAFYAADAAFERALTDIANTADWTAMLGSTDGIVSSARSSLDDGMMSVMLPDGRTLDLAKATNQLNCPQVFPPASAPCTAAQMDATSAERPWGSNNPRWRLFARSRLSAIAPGVASSPLFHVAVWVSDDPGETDGNPSADATGPAAGAGVIQVRADAFGPGGAHRAIEATIGRVGAHIRLISWRLVR
jgi:hypothetical protein